MTFVNISLAEANQMAQSLHSDAIKDPTLKTKVTTMNRFEIYQITFKASNQGQSNVGVIGFYKDTGEVMQLDPKGKYSPVKMFVATSKEQFVRFLKEYELKGADVVRIK